MLHRQILSLGLAGLISVASLPGAAAAEDGIRHVRFGKQSVSVAPVGAFPALPDGSLAEVDGTSHLVRTRTGVGFTFDTTALAPEAPYTAWWVVFNRPRACFTPYDCGAEDLGNAAAEVGVFFAAGRVTDAYGQANFAAQVDYGELPDGEDQVPNAERANPIRPNAEIHIVLRDHGPASDDPEVLEAQLTQFNGGCPPYSCANVQASVHPSPKARLW
ncbi:MAG: hypothetical protein QNJ30_14515 [Kiloniellales bacterium]|nr:hypothetical protein [Kiloniellales bacterium]